MTNYGHDREQAKMVYEHLRKHGMTRKDALRNIKNQFAVRLPGAMREDTYLSLPGHRR